MKKYCMVFEQLLRSKSSCGEKKIRMNYDLRFKYTSCYLGDMVDLIQRLLHLLVQWTGSRNSSDCPLGFCVLPSWIVWKDDVHFC